MLGRRGIDGENLVYLVHTDLAGVTRARAVPGADLQSRLRSGVGWVPANLALSAFGLLVPNPWGPLGDLRLLPDPQTEARVDLWDDIAPLHFFRSRGCPDLADDEKPPQKVNLFPRQHAGRPPSGVPARLRELGLTRLSTRSGNPAHLYCATDRPGSVR